MTRSPERDVAVWQEHRPMLQGLAYRMLGDLARAEDIVQEGWLRWSGRESEAHDPRAYLVALVTRLCLNELDSARARREESRSDRLPEPVDLEGGGLGRAEALERISMAFLVVLQRLTPSERAVLLLHDVFDYSHSEIADLVGRSTPACRKLLERARENVAAEKRLLETSAEEHGRLLDAFLAAATTGDVSALLSLLAEDAVMIADGGRNGRQLAGIRNLTEPLKGATKVAAFLSNVAGRAAPMLVPERRVLNGQPAIILRLDGVATAALLLGVAEGRIHRIFFQADTERLARLDRAPA